MTAQTMRFSLGKRCIAALLLGLFLLVYAGCGQAAAPSTAQRIDEILSSAQSADGADSAQAWLNGALCEDIGGNAEWYVLALHQYASGLDYSAYADALQQFVETSPPAGAATRLKMALVLVACGRTDHPFVSEARKEDIGRQGVMSWIYGLHLLTNLPESTDEEIKQAISGLLSLQLSDGGWAVMGAQADADVTAMALQALAPYVSESEDVRTAVDSALALLGKIQTESGDYRSMGTPNCESAAQVIIALCALNIDQESDERFIKNGCTVTDAMLRYQLADNGFSHVENGEKSDIATVQALSALIALDRFQSGRGAFYHLDAQTETAAFAAQLNWKVWAVIAIAAAGLLACILLFAAKKRNVKNYIAVWVICISLAAVLCSLRIESATDYYAAATANTAESIGSVTLTIRCDTVKGQTDARYIPEDGIILAETTYAISQGDTVYSVLIRAVRENNLQLDSRSGTSAYVAGICHLYEFDFGELSGWMYRVNGETPNVGCGEYQLSDGDKIEWLYTCDMGRDFT